MTNVSQKCQYALLALLELARRGSRSPTTIGEIAEAQAIPPRFLEAILAELRRGGFVASRRGAEGGYLMARSPRGLTVGEVIRFIEGPLDPVEGISEGESDRFVDGRGALLELWRRARDALAEVYDSTTFEDLLAAEAATAASYCI